MDEYEKEHHFVSSNTPHPALEELIVLLESNCTWLHRIARVASKGNGDGKLGSNVSIHVALGFPCSLTFVLKRLLSSN